MTIRKWLLTVVSTGVEKPAGWILRSGEKLQKSIANSGKKLQKPLRITGKSCVMR